MSSKQSITIQQRVFEVAVDAASFRLANRGPVLFDVVGSRRGQVPRMNHLLVLLSAQDGERSLSLTVVLMVMARWGARRELADSETIRGILVEWRCCGILGHRRRLVSSCAGCDSLTTRDALASRWVAAWLIAGAHGRPQVESLRWVAVLQGSLPLRAMNSAMLAWASLTTGTTYHRAALPNWRTPRH